MQKVYSRINWENDPSTNTPLSEDNLNKMDYALDKIDDRVVQLGGYQDRVAQSEKNAKTSETNAKASETNAKQSEVKAKQYMENAFSGTPEGYAALVEQVGLMDIVKSTALTYPNTKPGGLRLLELVGATVQNGEPSPSNPIAIENVGDCVEMVQGGLTNGEPFVSDARIRSKNFVPCIGGDTIKIKLETTVKTIAVYFYGDNGYISYSAATTSANEYSVNAPSGTTKIKFIVNKDDGVFTPDDIGKITLTVNGKHVVQIVEHGKNLFDINGNVNTRGNNLIQGSGNSVNNGILTTQINTSSNMPVGQLIQNVSGKTLTVSAKLISVGTGADAAIMLYENGVITKIIKTNTVNNIMKLTYTCIADSIVITFGTGAGTGAQFTDIQVEIGTEATPYEPHTEKVATIFLDEPLREGDRLVKVDGVWNAERNSGSMICDGNTKINAVEELTDTIRIKVYAPTKLSSKPNGLCSHLPFTSYYGDIGEHYMAMNNLIYLFLNKSRLSSLDIDGVKAYWSNNPFVTEFVFETPTLTPLDLESQKALNNLETFKDMTYLEVDSKIKPSGIEVEYGTSQVGAYTLKSLLNTESNALKIEDAVNTMLLIGAQ